jgi:hypothetical protein
VNKNGKEKRMKKDSDTIAFVKKMISKKPWIPFKYKAGN